MKKFLLLIAVAIAGSFGAQAKDQYVRDVNYLPQTAKTFIGQHFKGSDISVIKLDKTLGKVTEYEVIMQDGTEISFDRNGNWDNVEMPVKKSVPKAIVPAQIASYVAKNYPNQRIVSIDKDRSGYEIELQSGVDLKFNKAGQFKRIDD
ncbi:MAG: PepSY-like domain-containing protein [Muribaculaceae bacterium]|nr:PepSY-like domain-containing protein [Muribaculaceae bacterium]